MLIGSLVGHQGTAYRSDRTGGFIERVLDWAGVERGARLGDSVLAAEVMNQLEGMPRRNAPGAHTYLRASIAAVLGRSEEAMRLLRQASDEGQPHTNWLHRDMNLESLKAREDFRAFVALKG